MYQCDRSTHDSALPAKPSWQGFIFVGQNHQKPQDTTVPSSALQNGGSDQLLLSQTQVNDRVRIITLPQVAKDLANMGLVSDVAVQIVSRTASGSVIVSLQGRNLGIGAAIAQTISVEPI